MAGGLSLGVIGLAYVDAPRLWDGLTSLRAGPVIAVAILLALLSVGALQRGRYRVARVIAGAQVVVLLAGWALAQWPYIVYPDVTLHNAAAPAPTLRALLITVPPGLAVVLPSLWLLFAVFKGRNPATGADDQIH
jgi:cytochrome d ubiquinol oxidase subunit II